MQAAGLRLSRCVQRRHTTVILDRYAPGPTVSVQLAAWYADLEAALNAAIADPQSAWGGWGHSNPVEELLKASTDLPLNALLGLQPFMIAAAIPEPVTAGLRAVGFSLLTFTRRPRRLTPPPRAAA
ncbi:MAG: hypothetical protein ACKVYV_02135 [Limisphaerales bacterium]